jgi:valyl-tRNA synthetase
VNKKLNNEKFVAKAPEAIITKERDKLAGLEAELETLRSSLSELEKLG